MQRPWGGSKVDLFKEEKEGSYRILQARIRTLFCFGFFLFLFLNAMGNHQRVLNRGMT